MDAFALARAYDARGDDSKVVARTWIKWSPKYSQSTPTTSNTVSATPTTLTNVPTPSSLNPQNHIHPSPSSPLLPTPSLPIRRLTPTELRERRANNQCYNCDQQWSSSHRCRSKYLLLMGTDDGDEDSEDTVADSSDDTIIAGDISSLTRDMFSQWIYLSYLSRDLMWS
ncbi:uncharacterized protein LOC133804109 [Humulus lupulus]|uniref:uncharacterized protein LOC133804109 n=1 Tax=Humulus lupulus TaxID=3486 RepID=UPI002B411F40|nr:uncharacterized protein LOC133804109 [Humulus lupulus]